MKGVIFRALEELVVTNYGMAQWDAFLEQGGLSERYYLGPQSYPDEELVKLVDVISVSLNTPKPQLIEAFGLYLFGYLARTHGDLVNKFSSFDVLIEGIDGIIHQEVQKLYSEPNLPTIAVDKISERELRVIYNSPRKLCFCAEGLIQGAAAHFATKIDLQHTECVHRGAQHCTFLVKVES